MRFWMRRLSSGSVTSVQSKSLELDLDFLEEEECFRELSELLLELPAIFWSASCCAARCAVVADLFLLCRWCASPGVPAGSDLVRRGVSSAGSSSSFIVGDCCSEAISGDALCMRIFGGDLLTGGCLGEDI